MGQITTAPDIKPIMSIDYVSQILGVQPETVRDYVRQGKLRAAKMGGTMTFAGEVLVQDIIALSTTHPAQQGDAAATPKPTAVLMQITKKQRRPPPKLVGLGV